MMDFEAMLGKLRVAAPPPTPAGIRTHDAVPAGRVYRQWDTLGRLWIWVNREDVDTLPQVVSGSAHRRSIPSYYSIPVYHG